jgi:undecaprenyl-diphosphatase
MPDLVAAALLGILQGLTEFLPISSTAHLLLAERALRLDPDRFGLTFTVALHMGTLLAVLAYFASDWARMVSDLFRGRWRLPLLLALGTIPAVLAGAALQEPVERELRHPLVVATALVVGSIAFVLAERYASHARSMGTVGATDALTMGAAQAIALLPGISRSGITISAGLARGLRRDDAARFSFLLSTPIVFAAGAKTLLDARRAEALLEQPAAAIVGFVFSFLAGLGAVAFLVRFLRVRSLNWFVAYRLALAAAIVGAVAVGAL